MKSDQEFKADAGKSDPTLFDEGFPVARMLMQSTLDYGAEKYEAHSWRKVPDAFKRYAKAGARHRQQRLLAQMITGPNGFLECDHESGLPHVAHELFNLMAQVELYFQENKYIDLKEVIKYNKPPTAHKELTKTVLNAYGSFEEVPQRHCKPLWDAAPEPHYTAQTQRDRERDAVADMTLEGHNID